MSSSWWFSEALSWSSEHILVVDCDPIFGGFEGNIPSAYVKIAIENGIFSDLMGFLVI